MIFNEYPISLKQLDTLPHPKFGYLISVYILTRGMLKRSSFSDFQKIVRHSFTSHEYIGIHLTCISRLVICIYSKWIYYAEDIREYHPPPFVIE